MNFKEDLSFFRLLEKYNYKLEWGDILGGIIIGIERQYFLVDIGFPKVSFLSNNQTNITKSSNLNSLLKLNEKLEVLLLFFLKKKLFFVSIKEVQYFYIWKRIFEMNFPTSIFAGKIHKFVQRGRFVSFEGVNLFVPNYYLSKYYKKHKMKFILLNFKFCAITKKKNIIIISSKLANLKSQAYLIRVNMRKKGYITKIVKFGLFVNLHGIKCLLHLSEIPKQNRRHFNKLYRKGQKSRIKVIYSNIQEGRIAITPIN